MASISIHRSAHDRGTENIKSRQTSEANIIRVFAVMAAIYIPGIADAADLKVPVSGAMKGVMAELVPAYEKSPGDKVTVLYVRAARSPSGSLGAMPPTP